MTIDLCPFYSEIDLLLLRLNQHSFVDKFIIWEFGMDFQGQTKPLHFRDNIAKFDKFKDRIIYRQFDYLAGNNPFERAKSYRDVILPELRQYNDFDVVLSTDTDELIQNIDDFTGAITAPELRWYVYFMNYYAGVWVNGSLCTVRDLKDKSLYDLRYNHHHDRQKWKSELLKDSGWHFSWLGDHVVIKDKFRNFGEAEGWDKQLLDET